MPDLLRPVPALDVPDEVAKVWTFGLTKDHHGSFWSINGEMFDPKRVDHQVVRARLDRGCAHLLGQQGGNTGEFAVPVPHPAGEVLPAAADRRGQGAHRVEDAGGGVGAEDLDLGVDADTLLGRRGPGEVGVELVLENLQQGSFGEVDGVTLQQARVEIT